MVCALVSPLSRLTKTLLLLVPEQLKREQPTCMSTSSTPQLSNIDEDDDATGAIHPHQPVCCHTHLASRPSLNPLISMISNSQLHSKWTSTAWPQHPLMCLVAQRHRTRVHQRYFFGRHCPFQLTATNLSSRPSSHISSQERRRDSNGEFGLGAEEGGLEYSREAPEREVTVE